MVYYISWLWYTSTFTSLGQIILGHGLYNHFEMFCVWLNNIFVDDFWIYIHEIYWLFVSLWGLSGAWKQALTELRCKKPPSPESKRSGWVKKPGDPGVPETERNQVVGWGLPKRAGGGWCLSVDYCESVYKLLVSLLREASSCFQDRVEKSGVN